MKKAEIIKMAINLGIKNTGNYSKAELIREIQKVEGNPPCFQVKGNICPDSGCCWRSDCLS